MGTKIQTPAATLLMDLAERYYLLSDDGRRYRNDKPGAAVERLPEEKKELLRGLKSDDLANVRWPPWR